MKPLTSRERMIRTYQRKEIDRIPLIDTIWAGTHQRWIKEGLPQGMEWEDYFGFDKFIRIRPDNSPRFETKILEETDRYVVETTPWGQTWRNFRIPDSTPETLSHYYNTPEKWEEAKARMYAYSDDRIPWDRLKNNYDKWRAEGRFLQLVVWFGFDVTHSRMVGTEEMLIAMYEDPDWVKDMFDTYLTTSLSLCQKILDAGYKFDGIIFFDDMGYKGSPFFSPDLYRELLQPYHKRAVDWAHERGLYTELHSCGFIEPLLPDVVETGVEMLNPLEVKAGMDPARLKTLYGDKLAFHGGINAQIWDKHELVRAEMERIIPAMKEGGGYVFASDHSIPNSVSLETMKMISELAHKLGKY